MTKQNTAEQAEHGEQPQAAGPGYVPYMIDFEGMAAGYRTWWDLQDRETRSAETSMAASRHLRDETTGVSPRDAAKVLMTVSVMIDRLDNAYPGGWTIDMFAVLFGHLGQQLWDDDRDAPALETSTAWALWTRYGRLDRLIEYDDGPRTRAQVYRDLTAWDLTPVLREQLLPLTDEWLTKLRSLFGENTLVDPDRHTNDPAAADAPKTRPDV